jgi:transposase InsO family protein
MRGSLRLRHQASCPVTASGRQRDPRACRCSPAVQGRVAGVHRRMGYLPAGWRASDLLDFERRLAELRARVLEGEPPPRERVVLLRDWAGPWFERIAAQVELGRMSPLTYNKYEGDWRLHLEPAFGRLPLAAIDQAAITRYLGFKLAAGLSEATVKNSLTVLCGMLTDAVADGRLATNPLRTPKRARHRGGGRHDVLDLQVVRQPPKHLEPHEALALLAATPPRYRDMVLCALTTGLRRNELLALPWEWIDFGARRIELRGQLYWRLTRDTHEREATIRSCKYDSEREVRLWDGLAELLGPRRQASGWVFSDPDTGEPWKEARPAKVFLGAAYEAAALRRLPPHLESASARRRRRRPRPSQAAVRAAGIHGAKRRGKPWPTTIPDPAAARRPDLVQRDFSASRPDELWVADFTYLRCWEGLVFFACVIDVYSRRVVGWQLASHMRTDLVLDALRMALSQRRAGADVQLVHHSDAGSQYTSYAFTQVLDDHAVLGSIGSVGDALDNALAESFVDSFKTELIADRVWKTRTQLELAIVEYVGWFNTVRLHEALGDRPPVEFEEQAPSALVVQDSPAAPARVP